MHQHNHYQTLDVHQAATQAEIKQSYRRLVKQFHPDQNPDLDGHDDIATINAAYEVLGDPQRRRTYDQQLQDIERLEAAGFDINDGTPTESRHQRAAAAQRRYQQRKTGQDSDEQLKRWINRVYQPVNRLISKILNPLKEQLDDLAADPFDDELLEAFQTYLDECRELLKKAQTTFKSMSNPPGTAKVAADLFYCLNQVGDGIDELERFVTSYNEQYLHTGKELFRIAKGLRREAQAAVRKVV
ncbi:MAG: J domain-containing protein [Cyanobacteria bacterium J069]|nr:MAG: molecular chaperone DnaJ [Cyanobacteria bacterium J069]